VLDALARWLGLESFSRAARHEQVLVVLIIGVTLLFLLALAFAVLVVALRAGHIRRLRRREARAERWRATVLDVLGGESPDALYALVEPGEELALLAYLLQFARRLRGEEARALGAAAGRYLDAARRNLSARIPERRANAVRALGAFGEPRDVQAVLGALDDPSPYVAMNAAQALATPEHADHADRVMHRLWRFEQWSADFLSAMLARIGPPATGPAREILADDQQSAHARAVAANVLYELNDWLAADVAARVLEERDVPPPLAAEVLRLLERVGRAEHLELVRRLAGSTNAIVRAQAVRAAAGLGGDAEVGAVTAALHDHSPWVAHEAAMGLVRLGRHDVLRRYAAGESPVALVARQALAEGAAS